MHCTGAQLKQVAVSDLYGVFDEGGDEGIIGGALAVGLLDSLHGHLQPIGQAAVRIAAAVAVQHLRMRQRHQHCLRSQPYPQLPLQAKCPWIFQRKLHCFTHFLQYATLVTHPCVLPTHQVIARVASDNMAQS